MDTNTTTAQRLKIVRGDLSQAAFAKRLGVHQNTLGRYERGVTEPDTGFARAICTIFGVEPRWLLLGEGVMRSQRATPGDAQGQPQTGHAVSTQDSVLAALRRDTDNLRRENREMHQENKELRQENRELNLTVRKLLEENGNLRVAMVENKAAPSAAQ